MKAGHAEALRVGGSFSGGGSHPAKAEAARKRGLLESSVRFSFCRAQQLDPNSVFSVVGRFSYRLTTNAAPFFS